MKAVMQTPNASLHVVNNGAVMKSDRRASKPLMEKRRRERINKSLNELKSILLNALRKDQSTCHSKLEKADILEMTVRYLRSIQRQRMNPAAIGIDPNMAGKFRNGYLDCKSEVSHFLDNSAENVQPDIKARLMNHLGNVVPPQSHLPPQLIGQGPRLLTTAPPVPVMNTVTPLQIQMSPNTQMQQAMVAAAAITQGRPIAPAGSRGYTQETDLRFSGREMHPSPEGHREPPVKHARRISESSFTSSGFGSSGSPITFSPSSSPKKSHIPKSNLQQNGTVQQQRLSPRQHPQPSLTSGRSSEYRHSVSPSSFPYPVASETACNASASPRSYSPVSSVSDSDSDPVWRPW